MGTWEDEDGHPVKDVIRDVLAQSVRQTADTCSKKITDTDTTVDTFLDTQSLIQGNTDSPLHGHGYLEPPNRITYCN